MSEVFKRNKKHNKRQSASSAARKKGNNEMNDVHTIASGSMSSSNNLPPNSTQAITLQEFFISKGKYSLFKSVNNIFKIFRCLHK